MQSSNILGFFHHWEVRTHWISPSAADTSTGPAKIVPLKSRVLLYDTGFCHLSHSWKPTTTATPAVRGPDGSLRTVAFARGISGKTEIFHWVVFSPLIARLALTEPLRVKRKVATNLQIDSSLGQSLVW